MASLTTYSFGQIVQNFTAAAQATCKTLLDFSIGTVNLAYGESVAFVALWLQGLAMGILALTRAATSEGEDLDSWMADFDFDRLPGVQATGAAIYSRATTTLQAVIPVGAAFQDQDTGQTYTVTLDSTNAAYDADLGGYVMAPGTPTVIVPAEADESGSAGNLAAGANLQMNTPINGVDTVAYSSGFTNGIDAESDPDFRARFPLFLQGLASADNAAVKSAIANVQQGLTYLVVENLDHPGLGTDNGSFFVIVDDGSGAPPDSLLDLVMAAVQNVRAAGVRFQGAFGPAVVRPPIALNIRVKSGFQTGVVQQAVKAAGAAAVNATPLDNLVLFVSAIEQAALAVEGCAAVQPGQTTINSVADDFALTVLQRPVISTTDVTVGTY